MSTEKKAAVFIWIPRLIVLMITLVTISPLFFVINTSLKTTSEFLYDIWSLPHQFAWENYTKAWFDAHLGQYFANSAYVVSVTIAGIVLFSSLAGYAIARLNMPKPEFIMMIILLPQMFPPESLLMPFYIMMSKLHLLGHAYTLYLPFIGWGVPIATYTFRNYFQSIPAELMEAAKIDGATELKVFTTIIIPIMLPALLTVAILNFGWWGELFWTSVAMSASTFRTIPLGMLSFQSQMGTEWGPLSAAICLIMLPIIVLFLFMQKYFVQGLTSGAVKG